jgi:hypothetical protein
MTTSVKLGYSPTSMTLALAQGGDFVTTLVSQDGNWPGTAVITIEVADATWTATLVTNEARFNVDQADVDAVIAKNPSKFRLWYTDGATRLLWGTGPVTVSRA